MFNSDYDASRDFPLDEDLRMVNITQLAHELKISKRTIYRRVKSGALPPPLKTAGGYSEGWFRTELNKWKKEQTR